VDLESRLRLERDVPAVRAFLEPLRGNVLHREHDDDGLYWISFQPREPTAQAFIARVAWTSYPDHPPSLRFASEVGGPTNQPAAWPAAQGYRAPQDVCKPFTAEGQALHADWAHGPNRWRTEGNPFLYLVETVQADIDRACGGRAA
jgi:hypothetical protein